MDEALAKSGDWPNVALIPGTHTHVATGEQIEQPENTRIGHPRGACRPDGSDCEHEPANVENRPQNGSECDTREKLEADVYRAADEMEEFTYGEKFINTNKILRWLDRQAAITRKETLLENQLHNNPYVGLVRGKQWERKQSSDYYCGGCSYPVTDHDSYCPECGGALHKASNKPDSKFDALKTAEMPETDATKAHIRDFDDTREQLEADVDELFRYQTLRDALVKHVIGLLDRQAAITERQCMERATSERVGWDCAECAEGLGKRIAELTAKLYGERKVREYAYNKLNEMFALDGKRVKQINELTTERDILEARLAGKPECEICDRATMLVEIEGLTAERDQFLDERDLWCERYRQKHNYAMELEAERDRWQRFYADANKKYTQLGSKYREMCAERDELNMRVNGLIGELGDIEGTALSLQAECDHLRKVVQQQAESFRKMEAELSKAKEAAQ